MNPIRGMTMTMMPGKPISSLRQNASPEYEEMMTKIMENNRDKPVEEVAEMLAKIESTTARLTGEYAVILRNIEERKRR